MTIHIPAHETQATHCTAGLVGYPAYDFMGSLGESVIIEDAGVLTDPHLIPWHQGFGGWTWFFHADSGATYFVTHLDETAPAKAGRYGPGDLVGRLTESATHAALINGAHVHVGNTTWSGPGLHCGTATTTPPPSTHLAPKHSTPRTQFSPQQKGPTGPVGVRLSVTEAWGMLTYALGRQLATQDRATRAILKRFPGAIRQGLVGPVGRR